MNRFVIFTLFLIGIGCSNNDTVLDTGGDNLLVRHTHAMYGDTVNIYAGASDSDVLEVLGAYRGPEGQVISSYLDSLGLHALHNKMSTALIADDIKVIRMPVVDAAYHIWGTLSLEKDIDKLMWRLTSYQ